MDRYVRLGSNAVVLEVYDTDGNILDVFPPSLGFQHAPSSVEVGWHFDGKEFFNPSDVMTIDERRQAKLNAVSGLVAIKLDAGYPEGGGLHIALDNESRADLGAMATTAALAMSGATAWPESYSKGWITIENVRIPIPTPQDGVSLAASVGDYYAKLRQHARDLKDQILASQNPEGVDIETGWPE